MPSTFTLYDPRGWLMYLACNILRLRLTRLCKPLCPFARPVVFLTRYLMKKAGQSRQSTFRVLDMMPFQPPKLCFHLDATPLRALFSAANTGQGVLRSRALMVGALLSDQMYLHHDKTRAGSDLIGRCLTWIKILGKMALPLPSIEQT